MAALWAIFYRELIRYWREKIRIITSLVQPAIWLFVMGGGMGAAFTGPGGVNYRTFIFPGIVGMTVLFSAIFSSISIVWDREFGFLKEVLVSPASRESIVLGKALGGATTAVIQGMIILIFAPAVGINLSFSMVVKAFVTMYFIALTMAAFGIVIAARMQSMQGFQFVTNFIVMPLFFLSGAIYPLKGIPGWLATLAAIDPLAYGIDLLKHVFLPYHEYSLATDITVMAGFCLLFLFLGVLLFKKDG
ncbi:ABC transporter permease [Carboxydothermus ferrireducens]|uniref:Transport permease protein n=1 Tax=Carboxydothermus ferrireducens DSM 11255 TaxID=1119529 RepID=A0ABX2R6V5_9THEO|nr:ABC transporter permease [Carboxydothermus ferrireducens]NYE56805.1 ABC-2 type transport system permease protein [Carboxydothermus ferrireducens DSM 11255]